MIFGNKFESASFLSSLSKLEELYIENILPGIANLPQSCKLLEISNNKKTSFYQLENTQLT